jgi:hypothetical protein
VKRLFWSQVAEVHEWWEALWRCCHGTLLAAEGGVDARALAPEALVFVWMRLRKSLRRLLSTPAAAAAPEQGADLWRPRIAVQHAAGA